MNKLLTPKEAAKGMLKIINHQIKEMKAEGMNKKQIRQVLNAALGGLMYGPLDK